MQHPPSTGLLIFIRSEEQEADAKRFVARDRRLNRRVAGLLNRRVIRLARQTGLPVHVIRGPQQVGDTFGERFTHAFADLFARGYQCVIALGNDCPGLRRAHILVAQAALRTHGLVLGPAHDGGAYLIGLDRRLFSTAAFQQLPWQRRELLAALLDYGHSRGAIAALLNIEWDADDERSFRRARARLASGHALNRQLSGLLAPAAEPGAPRRAVLFRLLPSSSPLRGPPPAAALP